MPSKKSLKLVKIKSNSGAVSLEIAENVSSAIRLMADAVKTNSRMVAPKKNNHLRSSAQTFSGGKFKKVVFYGSASVPYAAYQERGMRRDGTHVVRHYTTPGTHARFLEQAGDAVKKQGIGHYLKEVGRRK